MAERHPMDIRLKTAFCGCNLRTGALLILYMLLFDCSSHILSTYFAQNRGYNVSEGLKRLAEALNRGDEDVSGKSESEIMQSFTNYLVKDRREISLAFDICVLLSTCVIVAALCGIYKRKPSYMVPILAWNGSGLFSLFAIATIFFMESFKNRALMYLFFLSVSFFGVHLYLSLIIYSYYHELRSLKANRNPPPVAKYIV